MPYVPVGQPRKWHYHLSGGFQRHACALFGHYMGAHGSAERICNVCDSDDICARCGAQASWGHPEWNRKPDRYTPRFLFSSWWSMPPWWYMRTMCSSSNMEPRKHRWFDSSKEHVSCIDCGHTDHPGHMYQDPDSGPHWKEYEVTGGKYLRTEEAIEKVQALSFYCLKCSAPLERKDWLRFRENMEKLKATEVPEVPEKPPTLEPKKKEKRINPYMT